MMDVTFMCFDCVDKPRRGDKPHRKLSLELVVNAEKPGIVEIHCEDNGTTVLSAEVSCTVFSTVVDVCRTLEEELRRG
jgi:hypothetical protein